MFDLDAAVVGWRLTFARKRSFEATDLDELEDHLRAAYEVELHLNPDMAPATAFAQARAVLGTSDDVYGEFAKVEGKTWRTLLTAGWVMFAVSWLLPVHRYGITLSELDWHEGLLPGMQAFLVAFNEGDDPVGVLSALTNFLMAATFWRIAEAGRHRIAVSAALLLASVTLNLWWLVAADPWSDLLTGYYAWTASFGVVGSGLLLRARALPGPAPRDLIAAP